MKRAASMSPLSQTRACTDRLQDWDAFSGTYEVEQMSWLVKKVSSISDLTPDKST